MTSHIKFYESEVYYNEISNNLFSENIISIKKLLDNEMESFKNFDIQQKNCEENVTNVEYDLDFLDQITEDIINIDDEDKKFMMKQYDFANSFISKYSQK